MEYDEATVRTLQAKQAQVEAEKSQVQLQAASSIFQSNQDGNLIEFQLELDDILKDIYIGLRGLVLTKQIDDDGNETISWIEPRDTRNIIYSDLGANEIRRFLKQFLNRNTILSNYSQEIINQRLELIGNELSDLIYNKYEDMIYRTSVGEFEKQLGYKKGDIVHHEDMIKIMAMRQDELNDKLKNYPSTVIPVVFAIESAYNRAIGGEERSSLRKAMMVSQTGQIGNNPYASSQPKSRSILKPWTWA